MEFKAPGTFTPIIDMLGGGPFGLEPGQWTDDTSMALCLAESLIEMHGFDPKDQMDRYCRWWKEGYFSSTGTCFDIGGTVGKSLESYLRSGEPFAGSTDPFTAGNGSLMRLDLEARQSSKGEALTPLADNLTRRIQPGRDHVIGESFICEEDDFGADYITRR